ncbi:MAG: SDR family oxidoreductase [Chloroflexi bacterium]|nr:SDR family oxidoreductase [Chloroflexota bacterium]
MLLKNKVALVTGAGRGWGQGIALAYARQGARVMAVSRTQEELERTQALGRAEGLEVDIQAVDLRDDAALRALVDGTLQRYGRMDVLVNNAGRLPRKPLAEMTVGDWDRTLNLNLRAVVMTCMLYLPTMIAQGRGSIINVSSNSGINAAPTMTDYCASKFALEGFTKSLAMEMKEQGHNIAVNTITPGGKRGRVYIKPTSMTQAQFDALPPDEQARWADPVVITEALVWLALQDGNGLTGKRVYAWDLSDLIRHEGWDVAYDPDTYA